MSRQQGSGGPRSEQGLGSVVLWRRPSLASSSCPGEAAWLLRGQLHGWEGPGPIRSLLPKQEQTLPGPPRLKEGWMTSMSLAPRPHSIGGLISYSGKDPCPWLGGELSRWGEIKAVLLMDLSLGLRTMEALGAHYPGGGMRGPLLWAQVLVNDEVLLSGSARRPLHSPGTLLANKHHMGFLNE